MLPNADQVTALLTFLEESCPAPLIETPELTEARERGRHAARSLRELDEKRLVLGFLGGTGVGKSTLLNAIAGDSISQSGERRPTTDRVVCYRHADFPVPKFLSDDDLATPPPPHSIDALRGVTLLDLPDIDSRKTNHRDRVHRVLPNLDLLVIVTSIDKYADRLLYEELRALPQAVENTVVILNAMDRLPSSDHDQVIADFREKLGTHASWSDPSIIPMSAKLAGDSGDADTHGLRPLLDLMEELGGDERRRAVLAANAHSHLGRFTESLDLALPTDSVSRWIDAMSALATAPADPSRGLVSTFAEELEETIGPWISDRALRASTFPISWLHFLLRRYWPGRKGGRVRDPFRTGADPGAKYAEEILHRPLRIAHHEATECARLQATRLAVNLPSIELATDRPHGSTLEKWSSRLRDRAPRLGWKIRHHLFPVAALLGTLAWIAAPAMRFREGWLGATWDNIWATVERLSPIQWAIVGVAILIYYLLCYPYFLYRLERRVEDECERGVRHYLDHYQSEFQRLWGDPLANRVQGLRAWWTEYTRRRSSVKG